jgi:purine-binding chemotaxis protein CheW
MTAPSPSVEGLADALRRSFDAGFAAPARAPEADDETFLLVAIGDDRYALRVAGLSGLHADRRVVPLPTPWPALLGLMAVRGALVPVYSLRALTGYAPTTEPPRWVLTVGRAPAPGVAFDRLLEHVRVARAQVVPAPGEAARGHVREAVGTRGGLLPVLELAALCAEVEARVRAAGAR